MEEEARVLNKAFMTLQTKGRPYIILKWAQSEDGFIDRLRTDVSEPVTVLSSPETSRLVHKLRSEVAAIMVGTRTALLDNPSLNVRHWSGNSPVRVVLDRRLVIPDSYRLLNGSSRTLIFTEKEVENRENVEYIRIDFEGPVIRKRFVSTWSRSGQQAHAIGGQTIVGGNKTGGMVAEHWPAGDVRFTTGKPGHQS